MLFKVGLLIFAPPNKAICLDGFTSDGAVAQLVEQRTENPCVPGSSPGGATKKQKPCKFNLQGFFNDNTFGKNQTKTRFLFPPIYNLDLSGNILPSHYLKQT